MDPKEQEANQLTVDPEALGSVADGAANFAAELGITQNPDGTFEMPDTAPDDNLAREENRLGAATMVAPITGGLKSTFETKDFLFGDTPPEEQSVGRRFVEEADAQIKKDSPIIGGLASGIGQFAVAMVGLGKLGAVAKALPWVGEGAAAVKSIRGGSAALESGKAALAGAIAFDPHEERLSNLIQDTPLANPFNAWLAAKPGDSAAMGRLKTAMESLGMDAAIIGTFTGGLKIWKYLKEGKTAEASRAVSQLEAEHRAAMEAENAAAGEAEVIGYQKVQSDGQANGAGLGALPEDVPAPSPEASPMATGPDTPLDSPTPPEANDVPGPGSDIQEPSTGASPSPEVGGSAQPDEFPVEIVDNPTQAMESAGVLKPQPFKNKVEFQAGEMPSLLDDIPMTLENAEKDWDAMTKYGNWSSAVESGAKINPDMKAFYNRFKTDAELDQYIELAVNHKAEELGAQGFRVRLSDEKLQRQVRAYASLSGADPAGLLGILQQAGEASRTLTAKMVVVGSLTAKAFQDASLLAMRRKLGDYTEFGSLEAMEAEIAKRFSLATSLLKITDEIRSQGGRTVRANRGKPFDPSLFEGLSKDRFYDLLSEAQGDPNKLKMLADPSLYTKIMDTVNYMRISSLVSGPKTQLINILTNGYMVGVRPLERILGASVSAAAGSGSSKLLIKENLRQYTYMGSAFIDGFSQAVKAITRNDGVLRPHSTEAFTATGSRSAWQVPGTQAINGNYFRPWDSIPNVLYNAFSIPLTAAGTSTRLLGGVDELVKQTVYRSKVAARAHMEATEKAIESGLDGKAAKDFIKSYVGDKLDNAFDAEGRGLDPEALREANIATFQQDLLPGTFGKNVQTLISNDKTQMSRLVLPFVKTPTNVIRYGWKMTPGLNLLQDEYRQMLSGRLGHEAKAQAIGQMTMGSLFMGAASFLAAQGMITGGGPSDPKLKAQLLATGWQPYSIVTKHDDGTKSYIPFSRYDPVALPFGIIADIQDAIHIMGDEGKDSTEVENAVGALMVSLSKQFTSRTYMLSLSQAIDALSDPDRNAERFAGSMAQSFIPFSGFTRQTSSDPYLRDARTIADKLMQVVPGMSQDLPPKYNWLGQPVLNRQGLWSDDNGSLVDVETLRLGLEGGSLMSPPSPNWHGVDLRDITMTNGENAYQAYQRLSGQPTPKAKSLRDLVADAMRTPAYQRAPDGDVGTKGTKLWLLAARVNKYREAAGKRIRADQNVRDALMKAQRKVIDHYQHLKQPPEGSQGAGGIKPIIEGFGASR